MKIVYRLEKNGLGPIVNGDEKAREIIIACIESNGYNLVTDILCDTILEKNLIDLGYIKKSDRNTFFNMKSWPQNLFFGFISPKALAESPFFYGCFKSLIDLGYSIVEYQVETVVMGDYGTCVFEKPVSV